MRFLIDTHVFLWFINGDTRLSQTVRAAIEEEDVAIASDDASFAQYGVRLFW